MRLSVIKVVERDNNAQQNICLLRYALDSSFARKQDR